jgi:hypothetical protein
VSATYEAATPTGKGWARCGHKHRSRATAERCRQKRGFGVVVMAVALERKGMKK